MRISVAVTLIILFASDVIGDFLAGFVLLRSQQIYSKKWDLQTYLGLLMVTLGISVIVDAVTMLTVYRFIPPGLLAVRDVVRGTRTVVTWAFNLYFLGVTGPQPKAGDAPPNG